MPWLLNVYTIAKLLHKTSWITSQCQSPDQFRSCFDLRGTDVAFIPCGLLLFHGLQHPLWEWNAHWEHWAAPFDIWFHYNSLTQANERVWFLQIPSWCCQVSNPPALQLPSLMNSCTAYELIEQWFPDWAVGSSAPAIPREQFTPLTHACMHTLPLHSFSPFLVIGNLSWRAALC